ncbi:phosphatidylinositol kinase- protein kinase tor1, partial [Dimargaris xerosporica]
TLGGFNFQPHNLTELVRDHILHYLDHDVPEVRIAAAVAINQVFDKDKICQQTSYHAAEIVNETLQHLLSVAIADSNAAVRIRTLRALTPNFDHQLSQADNIRMFSLTLNDEVIEIKQLAIAILGRLIGRNPAQVLPFLRRSLMQVLTELECTLSNRAKEECCHIVYQLALSAQQWVRAYVVPIYKVLFPTIKDSHTGVSVAALRAVSEITRAGGEDLMDFLSDLLPAIIDILQDQVSAQRRLYALKTLGNLGTYAGVVIAPYTEFPQLMGIMIGFLRNEKDRDIRRETFRVMGVLGAIDPYHYKNAFQAGHTLHGDGEALLPMSPLLQEDYDLNVVISCLVRILSDVNLALHHSSAIQAIMHLFTTMGSRCFRFLPKLIPAFTQEMKVCAPSVLDFYFEQLSNLIVICRLNIQDYVRDVLQLVNQHWSAGPNIQQTIIGVIESLSLALDGDFREHLPEVLPRMLEALDADTTERRTLSGKVLHAIATFGTNVEEYIHFILPVFIRVLERVDFATAIKQKTLYTICVIAQAVSCRSFASRLVHCILRLLTSHAPNNQHRELQSAAMDTLCVLLCQLQLDYLPFVSAVDKVMLRQKIHHAKYDALLTKLIHNGPLPRQFAVPNFDQLVRKLPPESVALDAGPEAAKMHINQAVLRERCNTRPWSTREDWLNWIHRFSLVLLEESPSPALRACSSLAAQFPPLAKDLFNVGFVTIWTESPEPDQDLLVQAMRNALTTKDVPNEILQTVLNLAEFMEHSEKAIQIDIRTLAAFAMNCNAYAKALHYSELTFSTAATADNLNTLIKAYTTLNQQDAAAGLVKYTTQMLPEIPLNYGWYERLNRWEEALAFYKRQDPELANDTHMVVSKMRCLHALCEWDQLATMIDEWWDRLSDPNRHTVALLAAGAAWGSGDLDKIDQYLNFIDKNSSDQYFFKAVLAVNRGQDNAREMIQRTRDLLDNEITSLSEGYGRAYSSIVRVQMLSEFEEILDYKSYAEQPKRQEIIRETWNKRLKGVSREVDVWQKILRVRSSVLPPNEDMDVWLQFADLCRSSGHLSFAEQTIASIIKKEPLELKADVIRMAPSEVVYAYLEVLWARNEHRPAVYEFLETYTSHIRYQFGLEQRQGEMHVPHHAEEFEYQLPDKDVDVSAILSRFHLKKGEWYAELHEERDEAFFQHVLKCYQVATTMAPHWYTAWHAWAQTNYEVITTAERQHQPVTPEMLVTYIIPAVQGFFKSIALSDGSTLQETLRLLSLLFNYGHQQDVCMALSHGLQDVPLNTWLQVVPQLIARIHARSPNVRQLIQHILGILGKEFPQALLFSLIVATKSENPTRQKIATDIMEKMKLHDPNLVNEAQLVGQELIRAALLWAEMWESAVAEASRQYYNHHNIPAMYEVLKQHHQLIQKGPTTIKETQFVQTFGRDLREAWDQIQQYRQTLDVNLLGQAWDIYIHLFKKFEKLTPKATTLSLEQVAPNLLACHDLELCLPGYFDPNKPLVRIQRFEPTMSVFPTKQKPRRIMIHGSDGVSYLYLLKGNEDLRQDERVMQLFELVNSLLFQDTETFKRHLDIERYPVVPLSPNTGLIGWVNDSDTFHTLIKEFRDMRKTTLGIEHRIMTAIAPNYDHMPLLPKVEVFEATLNQTHGQDLYKVLWLKSPNSEVWLERRTCYTRSLAVMSIVGYILGLGDRHPSNLMLHRKTGKVVHIDFGDCFEVSMHRDRFPENVPFRLTRMLILAMEMCGIEGTFRITCEHVMRVLRENKDSLMAVLEAFIYDPLINWRLTSVRTSSIFVDGDMMPRRGQQSEEGFAMRDESAQVNAEQQNPRAIEAINRISNKLTGRDFNPSQVLPINVQVDRLIRQATSSENLSPLYIGWCPFW